MKMLGIVLMVLGIVGLITGGISYDDQKTVLDVGGLKVSATERRSIPIPAVAGLCALLGGAALLVAGRRRGSPAPV